MEKRTKVNPINQLFKGLEGTSAQFLSENREDIEGLEMGNNGPATEEDINAMMLKALAPDMPDYKDLNREQKRRANKLLRQYKKQMGFK